MEYTDTSSIQLQPSRSEQLALVEIASSLETFLRPDQVLTRPIERIAYAHDASCYRLVPQAIVRPDSLDDVRRLMAWSNDTRIPLTFRAAGTSLSGQAVTSGVIVDITRGAWDAIAISHEGSVVRVGPGMVGSKVNDYLRKYGKKIGPDPASLAACMVGGIVANNASGMCCGVTQNTYHTLESLTFMLPNGVVIDSSLPNANDILVRTSLEIAEGLMALKAEIEANTALVEKIRRKYKIKNTVGYGINAFLDYSTPVEILRHLMVGSEGTLGFIAEAGFYTVPDLPMKSTALLFFSTVADACASIIALRDSGAAALELMDYASLAAMRDQYGAPKDIIDALPQTAACLLVEYQAADKEVLQALREAGEVLLTSLPLVATQPFTEDAKQQAIFWKLRKGVIPVVSAKRRPGTTVINEDIAFPIEFLADGVTALQELFVKHGYPDGVVFGHAKDGNLHFTLAQAFDTAADVAQFEGLLDDIAHLVVGRFDGSLKAEHGTGRNMAPYVEMEWGAEAYSIMRRLKELIDPNNILNPGVIMNDNPKAHVENLKPIPVVEKEVDSCIECGWCENKCPSQGLTLTPRQRIVVRREITRVKNAAKDGKVLSDAPFSAWQLERDYDYYGLETCATDGMCATICPVHINTGDLVKLLRSEQHSGFAQDNARTISRHFHAVESIAKLGVQAGRALESIGAEGVVNFVSDVVGKILETRLPGWNDNIGTPIRLPHTSNENADAIYFPACVTRLMGGGENPHDMNQVEMLLRVAERAGVALWIPEKSTNYCCGTPFSSKGFTEAYREMMERTVDEFWKWSDGGRLPILTDASSCTYTFRNAGKDLSGQALERFTQLTILDSIEYVHDVLLPKLLERGLLTRLPESALLHPVCSVMKLGFTDKLQAIAEACAHDAVTPINVGCCAFAGDRGMIAPELTANATLLEAREARERHYDGYYSSNPTCQIGMTTAVGEEYQSYIALVERATRL
ncbi:MAG: FAD-binding oxidoreductase [Candidatus Kapabacteria bacterium]|nr:FAD-binding oxidoreductase [Candidatus Kapabacteria bacterium]